MTTPSPADLSTFDWLRLVPTELDVRGLKPEDRVHYTGHLQKLDDTWLPSVGNWGWLETREMIDSAEPHKGRIRVLPSAYKQYRWRHGLLTRSEFVLRHGPEPWLHAELSWLAHRAAQERLRQKNGTGASIGMACRLAVQEGRKRGAPTRQQVGLLPIELVLYTRVFGAFLATGVSYADWGELDGADKHEVWTEGWQGKEWDIDLFFDSPAVRHLGDDRRHPGLPAVG
jgi:hypothetical protein